MRDLSNVGDHFVSKNMPEVKKSLTRIFYVDVVDTYDPYGLNENVNMLTNVDIFFSSRTDI